MRFIFTRDNLKKLTPSVRPVVSNGKMIGLTEADEPKPYIVSDCGAHTPPGLCLYVGKKRKTFYLQVRVGRKVTKVAVGDYPGLNVNTEDPLTDVRQIAGDLGRAMKRGEDIQQLRAEERQIVATTLGDVMASYLEQYKSGKDPRANSVKAIEAAIRRLKPWLGKSLRSIGAQSVQEIWQRIAVEQGHRTAAEQTLMWCRAAFNVHIDEQQANRNKASFDGDLLVNPFNIARRHMRTRAELEAEYQDRKVRNPLENTPEKLGTWLDALWAKRQRNRDAVDYMLLTLLLGARKSETAKLVWRDRLLAEGLDETEFSVLTLPKGGGHGQVTFRGTKSGAIHSVPLGQFATWLMRVRHQDQPSQLYVFPSSSKNPKTESAYYNSPREFVASLRSTLEKLSVEKAWSAHVASLAPELAASNEARRDFERMYRPQWVFTMHDLRRTFCTVAVNIEGMPYAVVQQLMNHGQMGDVTARYGKPTQDSLRRYMQKLEDEILRHATELPRLDGEVVCER
ncbi:integrase family protein [Acidovorax sp.]|uniref:integrase family protein n=1 Tax=Acidovorax sp. TaxID=1872122 RepID=UPI0025BE7332|nr:integrase family protein [Acidovorax sp.]